MKNIGKMVPVLAPVFAAGTVAWGAAASLGGYTAPVYGADGYQVSADTAQEREQPMREKPSKERAEKASDDNRKTGTEETGTEAKGHFDLADGTYEGTGTGFHGPIKVSVKIQDKTIVSIDVLEHADDEAFFTRAKEGVIKNILSSQSLGVDAVSGATYSSNGIISAVKDALTGNTSQTEQGAGTLTAAPVTVGQGDLDVADGTYEGSAEGYHGAVRVSVSVRDKSIVSVDVLSHSDDESFFTRAKEGVIRSILSSQSLEVDTVSGATYSSRGIINAVKNALSGQGGDVLGNASDTPSAEPTSAPQTLGSVRPAEDADAYKDGTYTGKGTGFGGELTVRVKISGGKIKKIKVVKSSDGDAYMEKASAVIQSILKKQGTDVDVVSGATYSSSGIIGAVRDALSKAAVKKNKKDPQTTAVPKTPVPSATPSITPSAASGSFPYPDGTYTGVGEGFGGDIRVTVVLKDKSIKDIQVISREGEDDAFFSRAETILDQIIQRQDIAVDVVSGATYSSRGILEGVGNALGAAKKAGATTTPTPAETPSPTETPGSTGTPSPTGTPAPTEAPDLGSTSVYLDGVYTGSASCTPDGYGDFDAYDLTLTLVIKDDKIIEIKDVAGDGDPDNESYIKRAASGSAQYAGVVSQILEKGSVEGIDTVSRATCSSRSILEACRQALQVAIRR